MIMRTLSIKNKSARLLNAGRSLGVVLLLAVLAACGRSDADEGNYMEILALSANSNGFPAACLENACVSMTFREFAFEDEENAGIRGVFRNLFQRDVLGSGEKMVVKLKDESKNLLGCAPEEVDCADGVRTYDSGDMLGDGIVIVTSTGFAKYMNLEIRDADGATLYRTSGDMELTNEREDLLEVDISLYPTGQVGLSAGALKKRIEFELPLSETANDILKNADSGEIKGKFECAQPSDSSQNLNGYPLAIDFDHDANGKILKSDAVDLEELYVGSPCVLEVTSKEDGHIQLQGISKFDVDEEKSQTIPGINFDHSSQVLAGFVALDGQPATLDVVFYHKDLDDSLKGFLKKSVNLRYDLRLWNSAFNKTVTLDRKLDHLAGTVEFPKRSR